MTLWCVEISGPEADDVIGSCQLHRDHTRKPIGGED